MVAGGSSALPGPSEVDTSGEGTGFKRLITDTRVNVLTSSANAVLSNDDLLIQILQSLPAISLLLYKSVSKQWLSLITCPTFTRRLSQKPNVDPPSGLFVPGPKHKSQRNMFEYDLISFDIRIPSKISTVITFSSKASAKILQSCNGLLLCYIPPDKFFVYNPFVDLFKMLPRPQIYVQPRISFGGIRLVFDPTKSPHYKVVHAGLKNDDFDCDGCYYVPGGSYIQIETYSSKTGSWSVCVNRFDFIRFNDFGEGIYSNGALHWLIYANGRYLHVKLDIYVDHPVLTTLQLPVNFDLDMFRHHKFFESRGCLLYVCKASPGYHLLNIFEMRNGYSEWSVKYIVNLHDIMMPFPQNWRIRSSVWCIVLGEREGDSFMVIESHGKVLQYKIVLKTVRMLFDFGSSGTHESFPFVASFAGSEHHEGACTRGK